MQLYSIASGSSGNCIYLGEEDGGILIDAGISRKRIVTGLERKGLSLDDIKAIFITHEHSDHISGLGPVLRKNPIPVYATADTVSAIWEKTNMNNISPELFHSIRPEEEIEAGEMLVRPFSISHDAVIQCVIQWRNREKERRWLLIWAALMIPLSGCWVSVILC